MNEAYKRQVSLLLDVLPFIAEEDDIALHGGTAINLFVRNMPRLSVDVDLTYLPIEDRDTSLKNIAAILKRIQTRLESTIEGISIEPKIDVGKLFISKENALIKLEINLVGRGTYKKPETAILCESAQEEFDVFVEMKMVPVQQLYGGKICAALDRQHPRDLFDVKYLLENEGFSGELIAGFIFCILGAKDPFMKY
ncbi:Ync [Fulvivirga imtechensis AK7]|uniref:Ync n=1 Tax=Fulvivirga imtechensis AK7 TaxID=1237149 RepID=L8JRT9_9BACT|nr:nucleotidyl transferase AbiEii/AbiGii toxin family protein [Fulvivirga imtechensis]ELR70194.1 Ync [Fulvivirga imtechensis AK7]